MTLKHYSFEGQAEGTDVTTANSGASLVSNPSGLGTIKFSKADKGAGTSGVRMVSSNTQDMTLRFPTSAASNVMSFAVTVRTVTLPTTNTAILGLRHATGVLFRVFIDSTGQFAVDGSPSTGNKPLGVTATAGGQYRFEILLNTGSSGTDGSVQVKIFNGNTATQLGETYVKNALTVTASPVAAVDLYSWRNEIRGYDDVRFNDGSTSWLGVAPETPVSTLYRLVGTSWVPYRSKIL